MQTGSLKRRQVGLCVALFMLLAATAPGVAQTTTTTTIGSFVFSVTSNALPTTVLSLSGTLRRPSGGTTWPPTPIYLQALSDGTTRVGYTGTDGKAYVSAFDSTGARIPCSYPEVATGMWVREDDGSTAIMVWNQTAATLHLNKYSSTRTLLWSSELETNRATTFHLGHSDVVWAPDQYQAGNRYQLYYKVQGTTASCFPDSNGHQGDTMKVVDDSGNVAMIWCWGLSYVPKQLNVPSLPITVLKDPFFSHAMHNLLSYNTNTGKTLIYGSTDCYPGTSNISEPLGSIRLTQYPSVAGGIGSLNLKSTNVKDVWANCGGNYGGDPSRALPVADGWLLPIYAPNEVITPGNIFTGNYDIGIVKITAPATPTAAWVTSPITWLTSTADTEIYPTIAPWTNGNYLIAFARLVGSTYKTFMGVISPQFTWVEQPIDVSSAVAIGERINFYTYPNGDVGWAWPWATTPAITYTATGTNILNVVRVSPVGGWPPTVPPPVKPPAGPQPVAPPTGPAGSPPTTTTVVDPPVTSGSSNPPQQQISAPVAAPVAAPQAPQIAINIFFDVTGSNLTPEETTVISGAVKDAVSQVLNIDFSLILVQIRPDPAKSGSYVADVSFTTPEATQSAQTQIASASTQQQLAQTANADIASAMNPSTGAPVDLSAPVAAPRVSVNSAIAAQPSGVSGNAPAAPSEFPIAIVAGAAGGGLALIIIIIVIIVIVVKKRKGAAGSSSYRPSAAAQPSASADDIMSREQIEMIAAGNRSPAAGAVAPSVQPDTSPAPPVHYNLAPPARPPAVVGPPAPGLRPPQPPAPKAAPGPPPPVAGPVSPRPPVAPPRPAGAGGPPPVLGPRPPPPVPKKPL